MNFGTLVVTKPRRYQTCSYCNDVIPTDEPYFGMLYYRTSSNGNKYHNTTRLHRDCFVNYIMVGYEVRLERDKAMNKTVGRPALTITPENYIKRRNCFIYLSNARRDMMEAYEDRDWDRLLVSKRAFIKWLRELIKNRDQWGDPGKIYLSSQQRDNKRRMTELIRSYESPEYVSGLVECDGDPDKLLGFLEDCWGVNYGS